MEFFRNLIDITSFEGELVDAESLWQKKRRINGIGR